MLSQIFLFSCQKSFQIRSFADGRFPSRANKALLPLFYFYGWIYQTKGGFGPYTTDNVDNFHINYSDLIVQSLLYSCHDHISFYLWSSSTYLWLKVALYLNIYYLITLSRRRSNCHFYCPNFDHFWEQQTVGLSCYFAKHRAHIGLHGRRTTKMSPLYELRGVWLVTLMIRTKPRDIFLVRLSVMLMNRSAVSSVVWQSGCPVKSSRRCANDPFELVSM